jgi:hypothetical protein
LQSGEDKSKLRPATDLLQRENRQHRLEARVGERRLTTRIAR